MAGSGAVVGLCPITEANLGDGLFPMRDFVQAGGRFGVGSDSNVLIDAAEELRLLEYGQRLQLRGRNVLSPGPLSTGRWLYEQAGNGAAQALGTQAGLSIGAPADLLELDTRHPALLDRTGDALLDSWLFAARNGALRGVWRNGRQLVRDGQHVNREAISMRYRAALGRILA
jgi:cytosine/adenosine deaminase-related metal-dependent hydrolase